MSLSCTTCDGRFIPVSPPVNSFLFSFFPRSAPGATLLLPGRVTSNDAGSHYHPYLRGFIAPSAQPSSHFPSYPAYIYIRGTDRVAAQSRLFLTFRLSICNNSVGAFTYCTLSAQSARPSVSIQGESYCFFRYALKYFYIYTE